MLAAWILASTLAAPALHDAAVRLQGDQLLITAQLTDPDGLVETVEVRLWAYDRPEATALAVDATAALQLGVAAAPFFAGQDSVRLMYLIVGLDKGGGEVVRLGSEAEPRSVILTRVTAAETLADPPPAEEKSWHQSWWFWIGAAGVVIVAGTITAVALANDF